MSKEKQIEEMAKAIHDAAEAHHILWCTELAKILYNAGYHKQSEGRWEIVKGSHGKEIMVCTNCRHSQDLHSTFIYCPNCGARMKGNVAKIVNCKKCRHSAFTSTDGKLYCFRENKIVKREDCCNYGEPKMKGGAE